MTEPALELNTLSKRFDITPVLKGISAKVYPGEVIGLLGLNGTGKTTLLETALGFVPQRDELLDGMKASAYLDPVARRSFLKELVDADPTTPE